MNTLQQNAWLHRQDLVEMEIQQNYQREYRLAMVLRDTRNRSKRRIQWLKLFTLLTFALLIVAAVLEAL